MLCKIPNFVQNLGPWSPTYVSNATRFSYNQDENSSMATNVDFHDLFRAEKRYRQKHEEFNS
jgi:hypothetical protein